MSKLGFANYFFFHLGLILVKLFSFSLQLKNEKKLADRETQTVNGKPNLARVFCGHETLSGEKIVKKKCFFEELFSGDIHLASSLLSFHSV
jgi:hypothetical protein